MVLGEMLLAMSVIARLVQKLTFPLDCSAMGVRWIYMLARMLLYVLLLLPAHVWVMAWRLRHKRTVRYGPQRRQQTAPRPHSRVDVSKRRLRCAG